MLNALRSIVGEDRLVADGSALERYADRTGFAAGETPACIVRPQKTEEVLGIVRCANRDGLHLVPCSSGGPRARGGALPLREGTVAVDLSGMDAVVRVDRRNKVALVEPGVTFGSLQAAADREGLRVAMPLAPRANKSVVASLLDREPTLLPKHHWDMSDPLCCVEVVFGAGELFRTGAAAGPGTLEEQWASGQAQKSPMGPSQADWGKVIQGAQGTLGIVTWASVKLELRPRIEEAFLVGAQQPEDLIAFTYGIVKPRLPDVCLILNRSSVQALLDGETSEALPPWLLLYSLCGLERFPEERVDYLRKDVADIASACGVRPVKALGGTPARTLLARACHPSEAPYWKVRPAGAFQDIFFLTTLDRTPEFLAALEAEAELHGYPRERLGAYVQPILQGRACHVELTLPYDPADEAERRQVEKLFLAASGALMDMGGFFSRPYGPWAERAYARCPDTAAALRKVKDILDPNGVMHPGKLCFTEEG